MREYGQLPVRPGVWGGWATVNRGSGASQHFVQLRIDDADGSLHLTDLDREAVHERRVPLTRQADSWVGSYRRLWPFPVTAWLRPADDGIDATLTGLGMTGRETWRARLREGVERPEPGGTTNRSGLDARIADRLGEEDGTSSSTMTTSVFVEQAGVVAAEQYAWGHGPTDLHIISSCTKSVTGLLVGIALDTAGRSADEPIGSFLPGRDASRWDAAGITLGHVIDMSSGTQWDDDADPSDSAIMLMSEDIVGYALSRPPEVAPGKRYLYDNGLPGIAGEVVEKLTGKPFATYAEEALLSPLGIDRVGWTPAGAGTLSAGGVFLRTRDMARIGRLVLNEGCAAGAQLIPREWVRRLSTSHTAPGQYSYSAYWHLNDQQFHFSGARDAVLALGQGGQLIAAIPTLDAVIVVTALNWADRGHAALERGMSLIGEVIVPALSAARSDGGTR